MYDDIGGTTRDNLTAGKPLPAEQMVTDMPGRPGMPEREALNRRYGHLLMIGGLLFTFLTVVGILLFEEDLRGNRPPFVTMSVIISFLGVGVSGIAVGAQEILQRYGRSLSREVLAQQADILAAIASIEYAVDLIAVQLPEDQKLQNWRGFNDAVRRGFTAPRTGTDGPAVRPSYPRLVPRDGGPTA